MCVGIKRLPGAIMDKREDSILVAAKHVSEAKSMREYANEKISLCKSTVMMDRSERVVTIVCDYSQNGEIPSFGNEQPGEVYYFSLLSIYIFGIVNFDAEKDHLTAYCYDEGVARKGGNNVASLLVKHLRNTVILDSQRPIKELNIIMDNCAGQNKNKMVIRLIAFLVEMNYFLNVNLIFYVVGHTKNPADRLFNIAKTSLRKQNVYTMKQFIDLISDSVFVCGMEVYSSDFYDYNLLFEKIYKDLNKPGVKKWQIFSVTKPDNNDMKLSMVFRSSNLEDALVQTYPIIKTATNRDTMIRSKLVMLDPPGLKDIKQVELYTKYRKYVPIEWQDETCPRPAQAVLDKFKLEKNEKVKSALEKKKEQQLKYYQTIAKNASTVAILRTTPQTQLPRILEHEVAAQEEAPTDIPKENNNSDDEETPNVFEA